MKILYAKTFGIGNAIMAVPAIKALRVVYPHAQIDALVGSTHDDVGAYQVLSRLRTLDKIHFDCVDREELYDLAILSIPFDGRWVNGMHFSAARVADGRTRPDPTTTGLISWKKHEILYQMDNVNDLGYVGPIPSCKIDFDRVERREKHVYVGMGYKRDPAGYWRIKHWGNDNFCSFIDGLLSTDDQIVVHTTGDILDLTQTIMPIQRKLSPMNFSRFTFDICGKIEDAFKSVSGCSGYFGNDTGMMHVAASAGCKTFGLFFLENSITKSHPWCERWRVHDGFSNQTEPQQMVHEFREFMGWNR